MKKTKILLLPVILFSLVGLSACSLFNDDDIAINNVYNPPKEEEGNEQRDPNATYVQDVKANEALEEVPNSYYFKSISYAVNGKIPNTYKVGGANENEFHINEDEDYSGTVANNNYDLIVPKSELKNSKHVVVLFIHGGAWVSGFKKDVNPYTFELANRGFITANIKYTLLNRSMNKKGLSIFRNLDEIDACITNIKAALLELFEEKNVPLNADQLQLVIGGASSGAHLAMLYTYSRGSKAALKPQLVVDAVGPVNLKPDAWKRLSGGGEEGPVSIEKDSGNTLGELPIMGEDGKVWSDYQTMRIANGMCDLPYSLETVRAATDDNEKDITNPSNEAAVAMTKAGGGEDQLSVTYYMSATNKYKMICAYAGKDSVVGINQFATLQTAMDNYGIDYSYFYFRNSNHTEIDESHGGSVYGDFINQIVTDCNGLLA